MLIVNCKSRTTRKNDNETTRLYFSDVRKYKELPDDEQKALLYIYRNGCGKESETARDTLIKCNQRMVISMANHMADDDNINDLISEGNIGLMQAIDRFDLKYKQHFMTYAVFWINKYMIEYLINNGSVVVTKNAGKVRTYANKIRNKFFLENCRYPTVDELYDILTENGIELANKEDLYEIAVLMSGELSAKKGYGKTETRGLQPLPIEERLCKEPNNIEVMLGIEDRKAIVESMLSLLNEREERIVRKYYGIGCEPENMERIAAEMGVDQRTARNRYDRAMNKIREKLGFLRENCYTL
jgi:RNA polymerase sigma factor (sigma-70 family)